MATVYLDFSLGDDARSYAQAQNPLTPWKTVEQADAAAADNDIVSMAPGTYPTNGAVTYALNRPLNWVAPSGGVVWTSANASIVARISSSLPDLAVYTMTGFTIDGLDSTITGFEIGTSSTRDYTFTFTDMVFQNCSGNNFLHSQRRGNTTFNSCTFSGNTQNGLAIGSSFGVTDPLVIIVDNPIFNLAPASASVRGITCNASATAVVGSSITITNPIGNITAPPGAFTAKGIELTSLRDVLVSAVTADFVIAGPVATSHRVIQFSGAVGQPFVNCGVQNSDIVFNVDAGHGIEVGDSESDNGGSTGFVTNTKVTGRRPDLLVGTPHNITAGQNTTTTFTNIESIWGHIGCLSSLNGGLTLNGGVFRDNDGSAIYAKGCSGGVASSCVVYNSGVYPTTQFGLISVNLQGATDNTAFTFNSVQVYVSDQTKINALATIAPISVATYNSDVYYLPNDNGVNLIADDYFGRQTNAAVDTLSEWQIDHSTDSINLQYSKAQIDNIISGGASSSASRRRRAALRAARSTRQARSRSLPRGPRIRG